MIGEICGDNRFKIIEKAKQDLFDSTNINTSPDEVQVIDSFLFRCWQMGWLDKYNPDVTDTNNGRKTNADRIRSMSDEEMASLVEKDCLKLMNCKDCDYKKMMDGKGNPNRWYCHHPEARFARSECEPTPMICRTKRHSEDITIKTSPRWCPYRRTDE